MSIPSIDGIGRLTAIGTETSVSGAPARPLAVQPADGMTTAGQQPKPLRFPWLSRLSQQLESASHQRPSFAPAPVLGDNLNKSA